MAIKITHFPKPPETLPEHHTAKLSEIITGSNACAAMVKGRYSALKTLQLELIAHGQLLYARKWTLRAAIEAAESVEAVQGIEISFDDLPAPAPPEVPAAQEAQEVPATEPGGAS